MYELAYECLVNIKTHCFYYIMHLKLVDIFTINENDHPFFRMKSSLEAFVNSF